MKAGRHSRDKYLQNASAWYPKDQEGYHDLVARPEKCDQVKNALREERAEQRKSHTNFLIDLDDDSVAVMEFAFAARMCDER